MLIIILLQWASYAHSYTMIVVFCCCYFANNTNCITPNAGALGVMQTKPTHTLVFMKCCT